MYSIYFSWNVDKVYKSYILCVTLLTTAHTRNNGILYFFSTFIFLYFFFSCSVSLLLSFVFISCFSAACRMIFPLSIINCFWSSSFSGCTPYFFRFIFVSIYPNIQIYKWSERVCVFVENSLWKLKICQCCIEQLSLNVCSK